MVHPRIPVLQHKLLDRVFSFVHLSSTNHYALMRHAARWIVNAVKSKKVWRKDDNSAYANHLVPSKGGTCFSGCVDDGAVCTNSDQCCSAVCFDGTCVIEPPTLKPTPAPTFSTCADIGLDVYDPTKFSKVPASCCTGAAAVQQDGRFLCPKPTPAPTFSTCADIGSDVYDPTKFSKVPASCCTGAAAVQQDGRFLCPCSGLEICYNCASSGSDVWD